jgi:hypothetical protein
MGQLLLYKIIKNGYKSMRFSVNEVESLHHLLLKLEIDKRSQVAKLCITSNMVKS